MVSFLILLLLIKIVISGLYLQLFPSGFAAPSLALAEDTAQPDSLKKRLEVLSGKEKNLEVRERLLKKREKELLPLKNEIEKKLADLNDLQSRLTAFSKELADKEKALKDTKIGHLVALYSTMEPAKAALIMNKLTIDTIVRILANMKGKSAGKILAMMDPARGAAVSEKLSKFD